MAETMALPALVEGNGFHGAGMGAGFIGGLVLGSLWNGNGFGFGGNGNGAAAALMANGGNNLANAIEHVGDAVNQGTISQLQSANQLGLQVANTAAGVTAGITQNTITNLQGTANLAQQICATTGHLSQEIDTTGDQMVAAVNNASIQAMQTAQGTNDRLCAINNNITVQGYEARLQNQALAAQLAEQHAALSRQIYEENCKDRELAREIQTQAIRDQLVQSQASVAALTAQANLTAQLTAQTQYLVAQLKPTTTTTVAG